MRRLLIAAGLLLALLGGSLANARYAGAFTASLADSLARAQQCAQSERWEEAQAITRRAYEQWEARAFYLHAVTRHGDADQILRAFRAVLQYLELREMDQYAAANVDLMIQLELLGEMEQASLGNVL